jgi:predicted nucleotidyltransferase
MRNLKQIEKMLKKLEPLLRQRFKVKRIGIFGSFIKGEQKEKSDIDILVEFNEIPGFFGFIELEDFLTEKLGVKTDLVTKDALKPRMKEIILRETVYI